MGPLLLDGFGDGIWIENRNGAVAQDEIDATSLAILQAARVRVSKAEYIACPSCGRTLYDIERTLSAIKARTSHLRGIRIGVMGCIVNGPGEMADADYGYVGSGPGRITLYKGREIMERNIPQERALDALVELIRPLRRLAGSPIRSEYKPDTIEAPTRRNNGGTGQKRRPLAPPLSGHRAVSFRTSDRKDSRWKLLLPCAGGSRKMPAPDFLIRRPIQRKAPGGKTKRRTAGSSPDYNSPGSGTRRRKTAPPDNPSEA